MRLDEPAALKAFLGSHGLSADKALGQHFLVSSRVVKAICARVADCKGILEIGPGPGILTGPLSEQAEQMFAIELDDRFAKLLTESAPLATVFLEDALQSDLSARLDTLPAPKAVVSNLPYYITHPLLTRVAESRASLDKAVLMMQKEVAEKILSPAGKRERGSLSVFLQTCFKISEVVRAPAGAFMPPPKVDSIVLEFLPRSLPVPPDEEKALFRLIRAGFTQPRKTLANNLNAFGRERVVSALAACSLSPSVRPHELPEEDWVGIHRFLLDAQT